MEAMRTSSINRHIVNDLKQIGLCLATCLILIIIHCEATIGAVQNSKESMAMNPSITWQNERLSIKAKAVPLQDLLDRVAKTCDLRIFSASAEEMTAVVDIDKTDWQVEKALAALLKGNNYLVVYNESKEKRGLYASVTKPQADFNTNPNQESNVQQVSTSPAQETEFIKGQIEMLTERIESGESDQFYEIAIKTKDPSFVQDDRKLLAHYQNQLTMIENGK